MHKKFFNAMYVFNIALGAISSLVTPIALGFFLAWLLVTRLGAPEWLYVVFIIIGVASGLVGMVRFVLSSMAGLERLEDEQQAERKRLLREARARKAVEEKLNGKINEKINETEENGESEENGGEE